MSKEQNTQIVFQTCCLCSGKPLRALGEALLSLRWPAARAPEGARAQSFRV